MRVLFVSGELIAGDLAYQLKKEGCDVRLYVEDESRKDCLDGMVEKTNDWREELKWVGKDGLIVFDDVGYGEDQDKLRKEGYWVVGGSAGGDKLEEKRHYAQKIFSVCNIGVTDCTDFTDLKKAIAFVRKNKGEWVIKQSGHLSMLNYVGKLKSGKDVVNVLNNYAKNKSHISGINQISLQKKVTGIEIGIARYFNGKDWVGPIEFNIEHKSLFNGDIGPMTGEMGTVMWYDDNEENKLFKATLHKIKPYLKKVGFKGDFDIGFIINGQTLHPLESTCRFGCPSTQLQAELHLSPWNEFLSAVARGELYDLKYKKGYGVIVSVSIPPFPYKGIHSDYYLKGVDILFKEKLTEKELSQLHFEEVAVRKNKNSQKSNYYIAGSNGYNLYVSGFGKTVEKAREEAYAVINKLVIPKMFYRTDIGLKFIQEDQAKLKKWGWI